MSSMSLHVCIGGPEECAAVLELVIGLAAPEWAVSSHHMLNRLNAPKLILIYKLLSPVP